MFEQLNSIAQCIGIAFVHRHGRAIFMNWHWALAYIGIASDNPVYRNQTIRSFSRPASQ